MMAFKPLRSVDMSDNLSTSTIIREFERSRDFGGLDVAGCISAAAYELITLENADGPFTQTNVQHIWNSNAIERVRYVESCLWRVTYLLAREQLIGHKA